MISHARCVFDHLVIRPAIPASCVKIKAPPRLTRLPAPKKTTKELGRLALRGKIDRFRKLAQVPLVCTKEKSSGLRRRASPFTEVQETRSAHRLRFRS
jgi:hypothetical protein